MSLRMLRKASGRTRPVKILLFYGLGGSSHSWDAFVQRARPEYELWDAELPWGSESITSEWSQDPDVVQWVRRPLELMKGSVDIVIAHSFAANLLLSALNQGSLPGRYWPNAAVLVSSFYRPRPECFKWGTIDYYLNKFDRILEEGIRVRSEGRLDAEIQHQMALRVRDRIGPFGWMRFFESYLKMPALRTEQIDLPCLAVAGEHDFASFPADSVELAEALPNCSHHLLTKCGHFAMAERPDQFTALIHSFLTEIGAQDQSPKKEIYV